MSLSVPIPQRGEDWLPWAQDVDTVARNAPDDIDAALGDKAGTTHAANHATGGSDPLTPSDINAQPAGNYATLTAGRIPTSQVATGTTLTVIYTTVSQARPGGSSVSHFVQWVDLAGTLGAPTNAIADHDLVIIPDGA